MEWTIGPASGENHSGRNNYKFLDELEKGQSVYIPIIGTNENSLRASVISKNKRVKNPKLWSFKKHTLKGYFEIERVL